MLSRGEWISAGQDLDPAHLWFVFDLFVFSLLLLPLFLYLRGPRGQRWLEKVARFLERRGAVLVLALPIALLDAGLGSNRNTGGWAIPVYLIVLLYGFLIAADRRFEAAMRRHRWAALGLGVAAAPLAGLWLPVIDEAGLDPLSSGGAAFGWRLTKGIAGWSWMVAILGFIGSFLARRRRHRAAKTAVADTAAPRRGSLLERIGRYGNEAVLPFYMLREPVIVAIAWFVVGWQLPMMIKYLVIVGASLVGTLAIYEMVVRRLPVMRFLFGMKTAPPPT